MITKKGTVTKISGLKTAKIEVNEYRAHPKYKKRFRITKNFLVHDEKGDLNIGDEVLIIPCRPISKKKAWTISKITKKAIIHVSELSLNKEIK